MKLDNDFELGESENQPIEETEEQSGFQKYQHIERFGNTEVEGIEFGECFVFPKIDGTNSQLWFENETLMAGSRKRVLSLEDDNQGFYAWAIQQEQFAKFFLENPFHRLYLEWLVPHTLKTYREDAWRKAYVFDVSITNGEEEVLTHYNYYKPLLEQFGIEFIQPICSIKNPTYEDLIQKLDSNTYLIKDGEGFGEGIVIKNYDYHNKYGRQTWAKIVRSEFKEKHIKTMGHPEMDGSKMIEQEFIEKYCGSTLIEKVYWKIVNENDGWSSKYIPRLLQTVYYDLVNEETWSFIKENKLPAINFKTLHYLTINKIKELRPELF
jgi:hypothetical protein